MSHDNVYQYDMMSHARKQQRLHAFLIKGQVQTRIPKKFITKIKIEQCYDKKTYSKLVLNKLNVIKNSTPIYTH